MRRGRRKFSINSFVEPFHLFYLGFLASVGLASGSVMIINLFRNVVESYLNFDILIYSRIFFSVFYLLAICYTYNFLDMKKEKSLRNGFAFFAVLYILGQIFVWI